MAWHLVKWNQYIQYLAQRLRLMDLVYVILHLHLRLLLMVLMSGERFHPSRYYNKVYDVCNVCKPSSVEKLVRSIFTTNFWKRWRVVSVSRVIRGSTLIQVARRRSKDDPCKVKNITYIYMYMVIFWGGVKKWKNSLSNPTTSQPIIITWMTPNLLVVTSSK